MPAKKSCPTIKDRDDWKGLRVLVRGDMNVPLGSDGVVDDAEAGRIHALLPTLRYLTERGARVVLISHIGRKREESLAPVHNYLTQHIDCGFSPDYTGEVASTMVQEMKEGSIVMLENVRKDPREKEGDLVFASSLAGFADVYVNDAFSVSHRAHASITGIPRLLPSYIGLRMEQEIEALETVLDPSKKKVIIFGGAKIETKMPVIDRFRESAQAILLGGALAHPVMEARGYSVGDSFGSYDGDISEYAKDSTIQLPTHVVVKRDNTSHTVTLDNVQEHDMIVDLGIQALASWQKELQAADVVLWNGPLGLYEEGFTQGSQALIEAVSKCKNAYRVVGGGDSTTLVRQLHQEDAWDVVSTGGGAMLEYLSKGSLPGLDVICKSEFLQS